ncbi:MAG: hypothetical protein AAGA65_25345 [Actinomycetota bacterium]
MSQTFEQTSWNLPPRIAASVARARARGRISAVVSFVGFVLCLIGLTMPRAVVVSNVFTGELDDGFPVATTLVIGLACIAGLIGLIAGLIGRPLAIVTAVFGAAVVCVMTILSYGDVTKLSRDSAGAIERGDGLNLLIFGVIVAGLAGMVSLSSMADNVDRRLN